MQRVSHLYVWNIRKQHIHVCDLYVQGIFASSVYMCRCVLVDTGYLNLMYTTYSFGNMCLLLQGLHDHQLYHLLFGNLGLLMQSIWYIPLNMCFGATCFWRSTISSYMFALKSNLENIVKGCRHSLAFRGIFVERCAFAAAGAYGEVQCLSPIFVVLKC